MSQAALAPVESARQKSEPTRVPAFRTHGPSARPQITDFLSAAGNMAIQRAAAGPLGGNPAASAILSGANMSAGGCSCGGTCEECRKKPPQRKAEGDISAPQSGFHTALRRSGGGAPLGPHERNTMESYFGEKFDDVRVHDSGAAAEAAHEVRAHAFTMGRDVYFASGRYQPHSSSGQKLLAHELTHVLQQRRGEVPPGFKSLHARPQNDVFEQEAEQVEASFANQRQGGAGSWNGGGHHTGGESAEILGPPRLQRKCACGGTCSKCSGTAPTPLDLKKGLQPKLENAADSVWRQPFTSRTETNDSPAPSVALQKKCACGGRCSKCSGHTQHVEEEPKSPPVQRKLDHISALRQEKTTSAAKNQKPEAKASSRVERSVATPRSRGSKVASRPGTPNLASARRSTAPAPGPRNATTTQRNAAANARAGALREQPVREVDADSEPKIQRKQTTREFLAGLETAPMQLYSLDDFVSDVGDTFDAAGDAISDAARAVADAADTVADGISDAANAVADKVSDIASDVWDKAEALADAIGGMVSLSGGALHITVPTVDVCFGKHTLQLTLPEIGANIAAIEGSLPLGFVEVYGEIGTHVGIAPEISLELGPCLLKGCELTIDPLSLSADAHGEIDVDAAIGLGGEAHVGLFGEVGAIVLWPDPPFMVQIPVVDLDVGLAGFVRGIVANKFVLGGAIASGPFSFSGSLYSHSDLGFALDYGLAGFGSLSVLLMNLCTLYWPIFTGHADTVVSLGLNASLDVGISGVSAGFDASATVGAMKFGDLGSNIQRSMFKPDCPLCDILYALGIMPSQLGGPWPFHPTPPWPTGPLANVYPINPGDMLKSWYGGLCRGACGLDCTKCKDIGDVFVCEQVGDCHRIWKYPHFSICPTADGCRDHDACYDWCANKIYERGPLGVIFGPCHRMCDFECICDHSLPTCVDWIFGKGGTDIMEFSDRPTEVGGCQGPCPKATKSAAGTTSLKTCLPDITIIGRRSLLHQGWRHSTGEIVLFSVPLDIPYIPPPILDVFVRGELGASVDAGIGPLTLEHLCLIFNPTSNDYSGTGSLHLKGDLGGMLKLTGIVGAKAGWGCLLDAIDLELIRGEAGLSATGSANVPLDLSVTATVSCKHGKLMLDLDAWFKACLEPLKFTLDAMLKVMLFKRWTIFSDKWELVNRQWTHCWDIPLGVTKGEIGSSACGGGTAAGALGLGTAASPPPALTTAPTAGAGSAGSSTPGAAGPAGLAHALLGSTDTLSVKSLISDLFTMATQHEVIHDKSKGGLPADPAKEAGKENPCGDVKPDEECGSKRLPLTHVSFFPGPLGQGGRVKASPLSKCEGNTHGSQPDQSIYAQQFECIRKAGQGGRWVRAHLLHGETTRSGPRNLHGPGDDMRNLIITDGGFGSLNSDMYFGAEKFALDRVYGAGSEVLWYDSRVDSYVSGLDFFAQSITVDFGSFDTAAGTEGPRLGGGTFTLRKTPPNCPATLSAGGGGTPLVVPPGALGAANDCQDPLSIPDFTTTVDGRTRTVKTKDSKHTRMAKKTLHRILFVSQQSPCNDPVLSSCEQDFCQAVARSDKKSWGGQIDSATRVDDVYKQLLEDAWRGKKAPARGEWTEFGSAGGDVGFDMDSKAATTEYTVHTNVTTGGKLFTATHLFPGEGES